jgi:hypothetical protein
VKTYQQASNGFTLRRDYQDLGPLRAVRVRAVRCTTDGIEHRLISGQGTDRGQVRVGVQRVLRPEQPLLRSSVEPL